MQVTGVACCVTPMHVCPQTVLCCAQQVPCHHATLTVQAVRARLQRAGNELGGVAHELAVQAVHGRGAPAVAPQEVDEGAEYADVAVQLDLPRAVEQHVVVLAEALQRPGFASAQPRFALATGVCLSSRTRAGLSSRNPLTLIHTGSLSENTKSAAAGLRALCKAPCCVQRCHSARH